MPTVPLYNQPKVEQAAMPGVRSNLDVSTETFGGGQSLQNVGNATNSLLKEINTVASSEMQKANEAWLVGAKSRALQKRVDLQYGENGFSNKKLSQVHGLSEVVAKEWDDSLKEVYKTANNDEQRIAFDKFSIELSHDLNRDLQKHVYSESLAYDNKSVESYLNLRQGSVANYVNQDGSVDLEKVKSAKDDQVLEILKYANRNGLPPESVIVKEFTQDALNKSHATVINKILSTGNGKKAKDYYDLHSSEISGDYRRKLEEAMASEIALDRGVQLFSEAKQKYLRPDGTIDEGKVEAMVLARKDWSSEEKTKALSIFNSRASEFYQNKAREESARDRDVTNGLIKIRESKAGSLEQAIRYANSSGIDETSKRKYVALAQKLFAPEKINNPREFMRLWRGVRNGTVDQSQLDDAANKLVDMEDWQKLSQDLFNNNNGSINKEDKITDKFIEDKIKMSGLSKNEIPAFEYTFHSLAYGKSPQEKLKLLDEQLKLVDKEGDFFKSQQWKLDFERKQKNDKYWGEVKSSIGEDVTNSIMIGIQNEQKKKSVSAEDMDSFISSFGGIDNIREGTPVYNAIQSISKLRLPVTKKNIMHLLEQQKRAGK